MSNLQAIAELVRPHIHRGRFALEDGQTIDWYVNGNCSVLMGFLVDYTSFLRKQEPRNPCHWQT
ncbi:MAG: hypothetical protein OXL37_10835 [Chloroflexota bacterium]|nr:hypothetical protein [Chloroflexota bacterium]MDE2959452.1 hypothetical protein [Chloroflexota bacterium]